MIAPPLFGGYSAGALLLVAGGAAKTFRPDGTARALGQLGLPIPPPALTSLVRAGGVAEILVGAAALVLGGSIPAALVAASYVLFAAVVVAAVRLGAPLSSCGCFGQVDAPPTPSHAVVNLALAACAMASLAGGRVVPSTTGYLARQPAAAIPFLILTAVTAYLAYLVMAVLPRTVAAVRSGS
jgi:hypothetical protein